MRNLFSFLFVVLFSFCSNAQLMRSEVYDFSVGDYFGLEHKAASGSSSSLLVVRNEMFHVLSKQLSITTDSVVYSVERQTYIPALPNGSGGTYPPIYTVDTITILHTQLNSPFSAGISDHVFGNILYMFYEDPTNECYSPFDTLIPSPLCINNSGQAVSFGMNPNLNGSDTCAIEPYISSYIAYSHAGGPYGGMECPGDLTVSQYLIHLKFVNHNGVACGEFPGFFVGLEDFTTLELALYPNPSETNLVIEGISSIATLILISSDGKDITRDVSWNQLTVNVEQLSSGIYYLLVSDPTGKCGTIRFTKN
jgi:Secretion system C-terminal sorting domain